MKRFLSIRYSASAFNVALFILRVGAGVLMLPHGYDKLKNFQDYQAKFMNFLGMGGQVSLALDIFAEFFCSILLILGLFTRFAVIPLIIAMFVAVTMAHNSQIFGEGEMATLYLIIFVTILFVGPGRASVDGMISK